jgi:hypothetical protein
MARSLSLWFAGIPLGTVSGVVNVLIRRWLPTGRLGGSVYGVLLLTLASTRVTP